jgi:hypothetical protein
MILKIIKAGLPEVRARGLFVWGLSTIEPRTLLKINTLVSSPCPSGADELNQYAGIYFEEQYGI